MAFRKLTLAIGRDGQCTQAAGMEKGYEISVKFPALVQADSASEASQLVRWLAGEKNAST